MSNVIEKTFDASKKIIRSIFKGAPNLLTATDLNRQFKALKYQIDKVEEKQFAISDLIIDFYIDFIKSSKGVFVPIINVTKVNIKGVTFSPKLASTVTNTKASTMWNKTWYICLVAKKKLVTYEDDFTHEISGAKFEDGTSMPAANNEVYYDEEVTIASDPNVENCVYVLGKFIVPKITQDDIGPYKYKYDIKVAKYWKNFLYGFDFDFQKIVKNPIEKFGTLDMAIGTLTSALQTLGNHVYTGKCLCGGKECGTWMVTLMGKFFQCYVYVTKNTDIMVSNRPIEFRDFKWQFVTHFVPVDLRMDVWITKGSDRETITHNEFSTPCFRPNYTVDPSNDNEFEMDSQSLNYGSSISGFYYKGNKNITEWTFPKNIEASEEFIVFSFNAIVWNHGEDSVHPDEMDF